MKWKLTIILTLAISAARIGMGYFNSISGPTLLYLAEKVDVSVSIVTYMFLGRSIGVIVGSVFAGIIKRRHPTISHLLLLGYSTIFLGFISIVFPWIKEMWVLVLSITIGGIMYGYLDAGLQALILQLWGEVESRTHIQLFHFTYSIGAFIAPLIVQPFLMLADADTPSSSRCARDSEVIDHVNFTTPGQYLNSTAKVNTDFNPIGWAYVILAAWMISVGIIMITLACCNIEDKLLSQNSVDITYKIEVRKEEPIGDVMWLFIFLIGYYFCSVATGNVFYNFLYSVTLCSDLKFTVANASFVNSLIWAGVGLGRLTGVFASKYIKPQKIILISIVASIIDSLLMVLFGEHSTWVTWIIAFSHGFTPSMMFPSGVSWISQITNVSGTYMFIFSIGASLGGITMLPLAGYIFDKNPFSVMLQVLILAVVNAIFFTSAVFAKKKHLKFLSKETSRAQNRLYKATSFHRPEEGKELTSEISCKI